MSSGCFRLPPRSQRLKPSLDPPLLNGPLPNLQYIILYSQLVAVFLTTCFVFLRYLFNRSHISSDHIDNAPSTTPRTIISCGRLSPVIICYFCTNWVEQVFEGCVHTNTTAFQRLSPGKLSFDLGQSAEYTAISRKLAVRSFWKCGHVGRTISHSNLSRNPSKPR